MSAEASMRVAAVIPCFRVKGKVLDVIASIPHSVEAIYCVDDECPEGSGDWIEANCRDPRVRVIRHERNQGVGGAVVTGFRRALDDGLEVLVKIDGDGQMSGADIPRLVRPILGRQADYTKGNRFFHPSQLSAMPGPRLFGNSTLSLVNKLVSGYWSVMDPTNGFVAIHASVLSLLPLDEIERRYFFESDMLFQLSIVRAVVEDVPIPVKYADEKSGLRIGRVLLEFPGKYAARFIKRVGYLYFLRDFNSGTLSLASGLPLLVFGTAFGISKWIRGVRLHAFSSSGTVMLAALPFFLGFQLLLMFLQHDLQAEPTRPLQNLISPRP